MGGVARGGGPGAPTNPFNPHNFDLFFAAVGRDV